MTASYLERVKELTSSRFWVNNPTNEDITGALIHGAVGCTTNPSFMNSLLRRAPSEILPHIQSRLETDTLDGRVADFVQRDLVEQIAERFEGVYEVSAGTEGWVTLQGAPHDDEDAAAIIREGLACRALAPNIVPKIPATAAGLEAMEALVSEGHPVVVTETFSLSQLTSIVQRYLACTELVERKPALFVSPITGIFGQYLASEAERKGLEVSRAAVQRAGRRLVIACYQEIQRNNWPVTLLAGGAREGRDFTGLLGGGVHLTINYSTALELIERDDPIEESVVGGELAVAEGERQLEAMLADYRVAFVPDGLHEEEYAEYGPVQYFRGMFLESWDEVVAEVRRQRIMAMI